MLLPLLLSALARLSPVVAAVGTTGNTRCAFNDRISIGYSMFKGSVVAAMANVSDQEGCCALCHGKYHSECTGWEYISVPAGAPLHNCDVMSKNGPLTQERGRVVGALATSPAPAPRPLPRPVRFDIVVKSPVKLPQQLPVLDRHNVDTGEWGHKPWITRLPNTGELLMTYSTHGDTLLAIRRSNNSGAPGSWGRPEYHPELSTSAFASPTYRPNRTDQEWSIHTLSDSTVLVNDGSCSMFWSGDGARTFRPVHGAVMLPGETVFHFNSTDECGAWSVLELTASMERGMPSGAYYFADQTMWRSTNSGRYWMPHNHAHNTDDPSGRLISNWPYAGRWTEGREPSDRPHRPSAKAFYFQSEVYRRRDGSLLHGCRVPTVATCPACKVETWNCDHLDGSQLWKSNDHGVHWQCISAAAGGFCHGKQGAPCDWRGGYVDHCANMTSSRPFLRPGSMYRRLRYNNAQYHDHNSGLTEIGCARLSRIQLISTITGYYRY
jgi:hypothetical protein